MVGKIWIALCMVSIGILGLTMKVEAAVTIVATGGPVQVFFDKEQAWKPLGDVKNLTAGDQILTGQEAFVELLLEDGSKLYLHEETQLALNTVEFSLAPQTRNFRFTLFWGNLRAIASPLDFRSNTFEIRTDTVIVGLKSSHLQIIAQEAASSQQAQNVTIRPIEGEFEIKQVEAGNIYVECWLDDLLTGIAFFYNALEIPLVIDIRPQEYKIAVKSEAPVQNLRASLTQRYNVLGVENASHINPIHVMFREHTIIIEQEASAVFAISSAMANQYLEFEMKNHVNAIFQFLADPDADHKGLLIQSKHGRIEVNGKPLIPGKFFYLPIDPLEPTPSEEEQEMLLPIGEEEPVVPPAPDSQSPHGGGVAPTPTQTPIPSPTPSPTPTPGTTPPPAPPRPPRIPTASPVLP